MSNTPEQWYKSLPPITRFGLTSIFGVTCLSQMGVVSPGLIILDWTLVCHRLHLWRMFTNVFFFGDFNLGFIFHMYFFQSFSSRLENHETFLRPGEFLFFMLCQVFFLDVLSLLISWPTGLPALGHALVFAIIYYWSRCESYAPLNFYSFIIKGYQFPFVLLFVQLLMGGNIMLDVLGLASGHIYYFLKDVVPGEYGYSLLKTPDFIVNFWTTHMQPDRAAPPARSMGLGRREGAGHTGAGGLDNRVGPSNMTPGPPRPTYQPFGGSGQRLGDH